MKPKLTRREQFPSDITVIRPNEAMVRVYRTRLSPIDQEPNAKPHLVRGYQPATVPSNSDGM